MFNAINSMEAKNEARDEKLNDITNLLRKSIKDKALAENKLTAMNQGMKTFKQQLQ